MSSQVENGKAFEWAVAEALAEACGVTISPTITSEFAEACFHKVGPRLQTRFKNAARLSVAHIKTREANHPALLEPTVVDILPDGRGQSGDVRDVVLKSSSGELGISCKSNHSAFKHPRLSAGLDFVKQWGLTEAGVSDGYKEAINPVFSMLQQLRADSGATAQWREIPDVMGEIYDPILRAFTAELERVAGGDGPDAVAAANALLRYFVGNQDFYKVIARRDQIVIQAFNFGGTLAGRKSRTSKAGVKIDPPTDTKSRTLRIDRYLFNARIHNASSRIEASLKFDIQAHSLPPEDIHTHTIDY